MKKKILKVKRPEEKFLADILLHEALTAGGGF